MLERICEKIEDYAEKYMPLFFMVTMTYFIIYLIWGVTL